LKSVKTVLEQEKLNEFNENMTIPLGKNFDNIDKILKDIATLHLVQK